MRPNKLPSADRIRQLFSYDPSTGVVLWRHRPESEFTERARWLQWNSRYAGNPAGTKRYRPNGLPTGMLVGFDGGQYLVHRLIWAMVHGDIPDGLTVDHRDCDPFNNRLDNLRLASNAQQTANTRLLRKTATGIKGVLFNKSRGKFVAILRTNGKRKQAGSFSTVEEAAQAYERAAAEMFGEFARPSAFGLTFCRSEQ